MQPDVQGVFLVAAASARRQRGIHDGQQRRSPHSCPTVPPYEPNAGLCARRHFSPQTLSFFFRDQRGQMVRALLWYSSPYLIPHTSLRLFIIPSAPYTPASRDTIFRWIVQLIQLHTGESKGPPRKWPSILQSSVSRCPPGGHLKSRRVENSIDLRLRLLDQHPCIGAAFARVVFGVPSGRSCQLGLRPS
ncbi:hypothetical protein BSL78_25699 [Apostichopus japonicus]|uniref:Uncharacterized protein n=1 Tax=Stichopus japonicus TaxID=307972 RepID=A0A2G8JNX2_STIJA|nr:hypothetical protein BSL78_25699 [Apostichopus japonicus]